MKPSIHYNPEHNNCPTAENSTARLLFEIAAAHEGPVENMDITNAYVHEPSMHSRTIYVKALQDSTGKFLQQQRVGRLDTNIWGGRSACYHYILALFNYLRKQGYHPSDTDSCLLSHNPTDDIILISVTVDDLLVIAFAKYLIDQFLRTLDVKYNMKRLGRPDRFLGWNVTYPADCSIIVNQPALVHATIVNYNIQCDNGRHTTYACGEDLSPPTVYDRYFPSMETQYRMLVGDFRYLPDSTWTDLAFITELRAVPCTSLQKVIGVSTSP